MKPLYPRVSYTIITNKQANGKKGSIVVIFSGTKVEPIIERLLKIPSSKGAKVKEITLDIGKLDEDPRSKIFSQSAAGNR